MIRAPLALFLSAVAVAQSNPATVATPSIGPYGSMNGTSIFPLSSIFHQDISSLALDPINSAWHSANDGIYLHHNFGRYQTDNPYGIPYNVVHGNQLPKQTFVIPSDADSPQDSLHVPAPFPADMVVEGPNTPGVIPCNVTDDPNYDPSTGHPGSYFNENDGHGIILDVDTGILYEFYNLQKCNGIWYAFQENVYNIAQDFPGSNPYGSTTVDAAGLPVFGALLLYDEAAHGTINHPIRYTMNASHCGSYPGGSYGEGQFVAPATHAPCKGTTPNYMGMRIRLKASFDVSSYSAINQNILKAMKKYGMILADIGGPGYFIGAPDNRWQDGDLAALQQITLANFDVVQMGTIMGNDDCQQYVGMSNPNDPCAPDGPLPTISAAAWSSATALQGATITLNATQSNGSTFWIDGFGLVSGNGFSFTPTGNVTNPTLYAVNQYGRVSLAFPSLSLLLPKQIGTPGVAAYRH